MSDFEDYYIEKDLVHCKRTQLNYTHEQLIIKQLLLFNV